MRANSFYMVGMIMPAPQVAGPVVGHKQTLAMMPAFTEDVVVLLALGGLLICAKTEPFAMWMSLDEFSYPRGSQHTIARCLKEEAIVDVHQAVEAEALINPANLGQQFPTESHQVTLDCIDIGFRRFIKLAQVFRY